MLFYVVLSVFIHPCTQKQRRAQYSPRVCVCVLQMCVCALQMCVCASDVCACVCTSDVCVCACASDVCVCALQMCACASDVCACSSDVCACASDVCVCARFRCVRVCFRCVCARFRRVCARALQICARASDVCAEIFSHSARLLLQQSRASYTLTSCLRAVLISSPDTWDWTRMHALAVMHRLCEDVDSAKIKVPFYKYQYFMRGIDASYRHTLYRWIVTPLVLVALTYG